MKRKQCNDGSNDEEEERKWRGVLFHTNREYTFTKTGSMQRDKRAIMERNKHGGKGG